MQTFRGGLAVFGQKYSAILSSAARYQLDQLLKHALEHYAYLRTRSEHRKQEFAAINFKSFLRFCCLSGLSSYIKAINFIVLLHIVPLTGRAASA